MPAMGLNFGDLDNDGWLDFYIGTGNPDFRTLVPNRMFRNDGGRRFQDVTTAGNFGHLQKGHGIAFGDVDNDGDQDVFEEMGGAYQADRAYSALYENPHATAEPPRTDWVSLELEGTTANRGAIGARVTVPCADAGRPARDPPRGRHRRQLRVVAAAGLRRPRRRHGGHGRGRQLAGGPGRRGAGDAADVPRPRCPAATTC